MKFIADPPDRFTEAEEQIARREVLPTTMVSAEIAAIPAAIRTRAFFSAGVAQAELLDEWHRTVSEVIDGSLDRATARLRILDSVERSGYLAWDDAGTIKDLSSMRRQNLIIDTAVAQAHGYGRWLQEQDPLLLSAYPARELYRAISTKDQRPWLTKWVMAGGTLHGGRMIARVDDPVWMKSLEAGGFNRFGTPYAPYDFNSGMRTRPVSRGEAIRLGVIKAEEPAPQPQQWPLNRGLQARPNLSQPLRQALEATGVGSFDAEGVFRPMETAA